MEDVIVLQILFGPMNINNVSKSQYIALNLEAVFVDIVRKAIIYLQIFS